MFPVLQPFTAEAGIENILKMLTAERNRSAHVENIIVDLRNEKPVIDIKKSRFFTKSCSLRSA